MTDDSLKNYIELAKPYDIVFFKRPDCLVVCIRLVSVLDNYAEEYCMDYRKFISMRNEPIEFLIKEFKKGVKE